LLVISLNQRFYKIKSFLFSFSVPKKTKFIIVPKCFLSDLKMFGLKSIGLVCFQIPIEVNAKEMLSDVMLRC
jgi:hypothetical protein